MPHFYHNEPQSLDEPLPSSASTIVSRDDSIVPKADPEALTDADVVGFYPKVIEFIPRTAKDTKDVKRQPLQQPINMLREKDLIHFKHTLPRLIQAHLDEDLTGKKSATVAFTSEITLRHVVPSLVDHNLSSYFSPSEWERVREATPLFHQYEQVYKRYRHIDPTDIQGYGMYEWYKDEQEFNEDRILYSSAALFHLQFNVEDLVRYIGGPHIASHRDPEAIRKRLSHIPQDVMSEYMHRVIYGAPRVVQAHNTEANFLEYYSHGNHKSCSVNADEYKKVMVKDSKRGNTILVHQDLLPFVKDLHVTPQGIVDADNEWKNSRPVYDSTFRPTPWAMAINDHVDTDTEGECTFLHSFLRYCQYLWNIRITYPKERIYVGDDDVKNAFRLVKNNPAAVSMHGFRGNGLLGFCTGQSFGDNYSPSNFDIFAVVRTLHAIWLWNNEPEQCRQKSSKYIDDIKFDHNLNDTREFAAAYKDSKNPGVLDGDGNRLPPQYVAHVDDHLYADVEAHMPTTVACSVVSLDDVFGGSHKFQELVISEEKLFLTYSEKRVLLGFLPDTRAMLVRLSPRRRTKLIALLKKGNWTTTRKSATLKELAQVFGMLRSAAEFFPWALAQLLALQQIIRIAVRKGYAYAKMRQRFSHREIEYVQRIMPRELSFRLRFIREKHMLKALWSSKIAVKIDADAKKGLKRLYDRLVTDLPWETHIGHIVDRDYAIRSTQDASHLAIGVQIPALRIFLLLPYSAKTVSQIKVDRKVHINVLEFIAIFLVQVIFLHEYRCAPTQFPPTPTCLCEGDNTSANSWITKLSTESTMGQNALRYYAEYTLHSPVALNTKHIKGELNIVADDISRVNELFSPKRHCLHDLPYSDLITQICTKYEEMKSWRIFLPSPEILCDLRSILSSESFMEAPSQRKTLGRYATVESISSTTAKSDTCSTDYFL